MTDRPATTAARGYGHHHQQRRRRWQQRINRGELVTCWRCGHPIQPGQPWDLGHDDHDRTITRGPEHQHCNRATASRRPPRQRPPEPHPGLTG